MDKVDFSTASLLNSALAPNQKPITKKTRDKNEAGGSRKTIFSALLEDFAPAGDLGPIREMAPSEEALAELMDAVHSAGSDLLERPFPDEIIRYKRAVRNFMHYVMENGYELYKIQGVKKKVTLRGETEWKGMIYHQVKVLDKKLEELAAAVISGQTSQLERVSKLDEIKGLLVDLTITGVIRDRDD